MREGRPWHRLGALWLALSLSSGCDPVLNRRLSRFFDVVDTVLYAFFACCGALGLGLAVGNLVAMVRNVTRPTDSTRLWGLALAVPQTAIGIFAGLAGVLDPPRQTAPETFSTAEGPIDWVGLLGGLAVSGGIVALGIAGIVCALRAKKQLDATRTEAPLSDG